jgi:dipeptidyl aminopeptidase/acylaminoacyl peptidase
MFFEKPDILKKSIIAAFSLLVLVVWGKTAEKRLWTEKDVFQLKNIRDLQVSPDGKQLYFVISERNFEDNRGYSSLWVMASEGGRPNALTEAKESLSSPRLSSDGKKIAYFSSGGKGLGLWVMNSDGSDKRMITRLEKSNAYLGRKGNELCWSPDGQTLAYTAAGPRHYKNDPSPGTFPTGNDVMVVDRLLFKTFYYYSDMRRTHVYLASVGGGKPKQISSGDFDYHSISYSPDGQWIACVSNQTGRDDYNANNDICLLSANGGKMKQITQTIGPEYTPYWSPDGEDILYLGRNREHRSKESDAELYKVCVILREGGDAVNLTEPLDRWSGSPAWTEDGEKVYFTAQNHGRVGLYSAPKKGHAVNKVFEENGQVEDFCMGKNGDIFLVYTDFTHPEEIFRINETQNIEKKQLTNLHQEFVNEVKIAGSELFSYPSFDGLEIEGWLMQPADFKKGESYPLIHSIHGGPHGQFGYSLSRTRMLQYFAANGYAVMFINYRGSTGRGQAFSDLIVGDLCGGEYKDLMLGLDYVLNKYDFIDPDRLGVTGGSYGGYLSNWIITQTKRYKAAVPVASISHILTDWGTDANPMWFESDGGFMPIDDFDKAFGMSPIKYVKNCTTPTMFVHGAWDFCCNLNQPELMFTALKKLGVDAVLAIYPNEGHGINRYPHHVVDYYQRTVAWFDKYLKK